MQVNKIIRVSVQIIMVFAVALALTVIANMIMPADYTMTPEQYHALPYCQR